MECYNCGAKLGNGEICPSCGTNIKIYRKMIHLSNYYYNDGLAKAGVRDLSGAIESLKNSLYYNKKNIIARNLLGLIYFEMGETVSALSEWVISKNYRAEKNAADKYLRELQKNPAQLDAINQTIKKYNQAIAYCNQGSEDLAIIQLKKVISLNSKMIRAHQLLALIYIKQEKYDIATKYLKNVERIDANNTTTLRYQKEVKAQQKENKKSKKEDRISYQSGNDTIIQPTRHFTENSGISIIINILVGVAIGVAITCFLVVPSIRHSSTSDKRAELTEANNTITTKEQTITSLQNQVDELTSQVESAQNETAGAANRINSYGKLVEAYAAFITENREAANAALQQVNVEDLDEATKAIYESTNAQINTAMMETMYEEGTTAYNTYDYQTAVNDLKQVVDTDPTYGEGYAVYYLAQSYRRLEDMNNAVLYYQKVIELYPGTERARTAQTVIDENPDAVAAVAGQAETATDGTTTDGTATDGTTPNGTTTDGTTTDGTDAGTGE